MEWIKYKVNIGMNIISCRRLCTKAGTHVCWSAPQECSTVYWGWGTGWGTYGLRDVSGKSHMIERDQIVMTGVTGVIEECCSDKSHDCNSQYSIPFLGMNP